MWMCVRDKQRRYKQQSGCAVETNFLAADGMALLLYNTISGYEKII